jgi:methyl-accepting chemotaxis protein
MGTSIGCIVTTQSTFTQESIMETSNLLSESSHELLLKMSNLEKQARELNALGTQLFDISSQTVNIVKNMDDILDIINSISTQTNLLGLNAAIEAARLGSAGKAFSVVADEIRKLARRSTASITDVTAALESVKKHNLNIHEKSEDISKFVKSQVDTVNIASSSSQELTAMANELKRIANQLWDLKE